MNYPNTPGVKVKEVSTLPPSIVQVSTAIPVFLGYTEKGPLLEAVRITSFKEFEDIFGSTFSYTFSIDASDLVTAPTDFNLFFNEAIRMYFFNGGGACHIIAVEHHSTYIALDDAHFVNGINLIDKLDEPTLIAFPEAVGLAKADYDTVVSAALSISNDTKDKFTLIDSPTDSDLLDFNSDIGVQPLGLTAFRNGITANLSYGAVYFPDLLVNLNYSYDETASAYNGVTLKVLRDSNHADYPKAIALIDAAHQVVLPPSSLIAGVYAKVDREKGVWAAPANVSLQGVIKPTRAISDALQNELNVDAGTGKSINAIREFAGKGTVVWGARTLAGNSNEWRYIQVRRLFMTVEESVKKATSQFVFENNDAKTWVKVSSMIRSYLNGLWKEGALTGATPEEAYFVQIGLGTTMTEMDVLEGKMIVKIGIAAVRPAEFIVLEFSHFVNQ